MPWTLANILTLGRLGLLPPILWLLQPRRVNGTTVRVAVTLYIVAGVLDMVDGRLARKSNQVTTFGKFLDPLVDKLFHLLTQVALLSLPGCWIPAWVVMLNVTRELLVTGLRAMAAAEGMVIAAGQGGKAKTAVATAGIVALMLHGPCRLGFGAWSIRVDAYRVGLALSILALGLAWSSAWGYNQLFRSRTGRS